MSSYLKQVIEGELIEKQSRGRQRTTLVDVTLKEIVISAYSELKKKPSYRHSWKRL